MSWLLKQQTTVTKRKATVIKRKVQFFLISRLAELRIAYEAGLRTADAPVRTFLSRTACLKGGGEKLLSSKTC